MSFGARSQDTGRSFMMFSMYKCHFEEKVDKYNSYNVYLHFLFAELEI